MADQKSHNKTLNEILDQEFARVVATGASKKFKQDDQFDVAAQAKFLSIDRTTLGRFRNGGRSLPRRRAQSFAELFRPGGSGDEIRTLADELFIAGRIGASDDQIAVEDWFDREELHQSLLLVEFREPPALRPDGGHEKLVECVGNSIVNGLSYAMLFPFSTTQHPKPSIRFYLADVKKAVRRTYDIILHDILETLSADGKPVTELEAAANRLRLYALKPEDVGACDRRCPGIGDRLFHVRYPDRLEQWLWVTVSGKTTMILRDTTQSRLNAHAECYFPIIDCWDQNDHRGLPTTKELTNFCKDNDLGEPQWEVVDPRDSSTIVQDFRKAKDAYENQTL